MDSLARSLNFKREEMPLALLSALFFFCVLCGYFFLRPVRDAMGVSGGMDDLRWLFVATSVVSLFVALAFGGVVARTNRRRFIPIAYLFIIVCLFVFAGLLIADGMAGGGLIGTDAESSLSRGVGYTFFVWLSVINLFSTAVFWAFMVDIFDVDQGKRMFAFIGIGGTLGALVGGWGTTWISGVTESVFLPAGLMLVAAVFFAVSIAIVLALDRLAAASEVSKLGTGGAEMAPGRSEEVVGGSFWEGMQSVVRSPYILGIAGYIILMAVSNTLIYFAQANIILDNSDNFSQLVGGFAQFDMLAQIATLLTQIFVTTHVIKKIGVGWTLAILPAVTMAGFAILSVWTLYGVMAIFQAVHRATRYAISRPARETLWSVVQPSEKYKAKTVVDLFLYRGGDVAGVGVDGAFAALGLGLGATAGATVPLVGVWAVLSVSLGRSQQRLDQGSDDPMEQPEEVSTPGS